MAKMGDRVVLVRGHCDLSQLSQNQAQDRRYPDELPQQAMATE